MKRILFLTMFLLLCVPAFAKVNSVPITSGRILVGKTFQGGRADLRWDVFSLNFVIKNGQQNPWYDACYRPCSPGGTFKVFDFNVSQYYLDTTGTTIVANGKTYDGADFSGNLNVEGETFFIPRTSKRKGFVYLRKSFKMSGRMRLCQVSTFAAHCPADKSLFDGDVSGHGTLTVKLKIKTFTSNNRVYLEQESFDYVFEP